MVHLALLLGTFDVVDLEELEYGNVAVAALDGQLFESGYGGLVTDPGLGDEHLMDGAGRRRRTIWSVEPLVTPFFFLLGPSLGSLKVFAIVGGGVWAALWFAVARRISPAALPWALGLLFVLPVPLVQRAAISATSITAHLGSSLWHGLALVLLLQAVNREEKQRRVAFVASGVAAGLGLHCSFSLGPLLAGVVFLAWRLGGLRAAGLWAAGLLPGLGLVAGFRDPTRSTAGNDLITRLTGLSPGSVSRSEDGSAISETFDTVLHFGAGFGEVDPDSLMLAYRPDSAPYFVGLLVLALGGLAARWLAKSAVESRPLHWDLVLSLVISTVSFVAVFLAVGFTLETDFFDGLRYLLPLAAIPSLVVAWAVGQVGPRLGSAVAAAVVVSHALGFLLFFRPAVFPAPWFSLAGYEPVVMRAWMKSPLDADAVSERRLHRWALWAGVTEARRSSGVEGWDELEEAAARNGLQGEGSEDFWRGYGLGLLLRQEGQEEIDFHIAGAPGLVVERLAEGAGLGTAYASCNGLLRQKLVEQLPSSQHVALWYGFGRADLYCRAGDALHRPAEMDTAYMEGFRDAWFLDYGTRPDREVDPDWLERLKIY